MDRRKFLLAAGTAAMVALPGITVAEHRRDMDLLTGLETRRSIRAFTQAPVAENDIATILRAAMLAPSAANEQPWEFVVIRNPASLAKISQINPYAAYAKDAPLAILACLNESREKVKGMGILDIAMSAENILLAAHGLGLGSVFTGIYPIPNRIKAFQQMFGLPADIVPVGLIIIGHPVDPIPQRADDRFRPDSIHMEKW